MRVNPCKTCWGTAIEGATRIQDKRLGVRAKEEFEGGVANIFQHIEGHDQLTARELGQHYTGPKPDGQNLPMPEEVEKKAPSDPNVVIDGGVHNPTSSHWQVGGIGNWWPIKNRKTYAKRRMNS